MKLKVVLGVDGWWVCMVTVACRHRLHGPYRTKREARNMKRCVEPQFPTTTLGDFHVL